VAVADYVDSDGPLPRPLRDGFRMQRLGAPFDGGWMKWPLRWLRPVETALNVYEILTAVGQAMSTLKEDRLEKWRQENQRLIKQSLDIQRVRDELESDAKQDTTDRR
jgi:hypothetical protein